jgi:agmatinase
MYGNVFTFLDAPLCPDPAGVEADLAVLGIPYDLATSGRAGTRSGPHAIRQASANLRWEGARWPWPFALAERLRVIDCGDVHFYPGDHAEFVAECEARADEILQSGKTLLSLGGDHFVALPLLRAHARRHGKLALIHFDAHTDTDSEGRKYDHGAMFHHAWQEGLLDESRSVQVGIRTWYDQQDHPFSVIDADRCCSMSPAEIGASIRGIVADQAAYVSFDIDCLDPAYAPGTGTPVAGGLSSNRALQVLRNLDGLNLVGMDVVEVCPAHDVAGITALAAATLGLEFMYLVANARGGA